MQILRATRYDDVLWSVAQPAFAVVLGVLFGAPAVTFADDIARNAAGCGYNEHWDNGMSMCMPVATADSASTMLAGQFNAFGAFSTASGSRGFDQVAAPNMFMVDAGKKIGGRQLINLDFMGTAELWTYPVNGYPQLLQIGEERSDGTPFIDAQHPHSSPIMGLTLSDTVTLDGHRSLKLFVSPRGESTDGPIAFMHRLSARDNPDAPLGHHVGQDVGHISSTVVGAQLDLGRLVLEASVFNGTEPEPAHVDLRLGPLDSAALRATYVVSAGYRVMASVARVKQQDPMYPGTNSATRLSTSLYNHSVFDSWAIDHSFVIGSITRHPTASALSSILDEAVFARGASDVWGRVELLQRLRSELNILSPLAPATDDDKRWISALTLGYTHWTQMRNGLALGFGTSLTMDVLPGDWSIAYGCSTPLTFRLIVQIRGAGHWQR